MFVTWLFFLHFLADFAAQSRYVADNKSKNIKVLAYHVLIYVSILFFGLIPFLYKENSSFGSFLVINAVFHFFTDAVTSKLSGQRWRANDVWGFFCVVGFDQFLHYSTLFITTLYFFKQMIGV